MLSRGKMQFLTDQMRENFAESLPEDKDRNFAEALKLEQAMFAEASWGDKESSMISPKAMPFVFKMIERLRSKYQDSFNAMGQTAGVLRELEETLNKKIQTVEGVGPRDEEKIGQYQTALRALTAPYSWFNPDNSLMDDQYPLREVLAYMWIATNDIANGAVLRPQHERELNLIIDATEKANKRKEIQEQAILNFIFNLVEIRRAHNTTSLNAETFQPDLQSCKPGTFGRLVFKGAPYNAITTLTTEDLDYSAIEAAAQSYAKIGAPPFDTIPKEIEKFILAQLTLQDEATKKSIFLCYSEFTGGGFEPLEPDASAEEVDAFKQTMVKFDGWRPLFEGFLNNLSKQENAFIDHLKREINFTDGNNTQLAIDLYHSVIADMQPSKLLTTSYSDVYQNQDDRNFVGNLRRVAVPELQKKKLEDWNRDEKVLGLRVKIRELSYQIELLNNLILNEVRKGLLQGYSAQPQGNSAEADKRNEFLSEIIANVKYYSDFLQNNLKEELNTYQDQLIALLQRGKQKTEVYMSFDIVLSAAELENLQGRALRTTNKANYLFYSSKEIATQFLALQASANSELTFGEQVQALNQRLGMEVNMQWNTPEAWATEIVRIVSTMHDKQLEIDRIKAQMESGCHPKMQLEIKKKIGAAFTKAMRDPKNSKLTWQERRQIVQSLTAMFPNDDLGLKYQALKGFKEVLAENNVLFDQQLAHEVFDAADQPLLLATLETEPNLKGKAVDSNAFNEAYNIWYSKAASLLELATENPTMEAFFSQLDQKDPNREIRFKKLEQLIILTVYRNLQLTDMRMEDIRIIRWLCNLYLGKPEQKSEGEGPMFDLKKEDNLSDCLHYLAMHLCCMLTTLKPVATLYNTGHIRIMNGQTARKIWDATESKKPRITFFIRTSTNQPNTLSITQIERHGRRKTCKDTRLSTKENPSKINSTIEIAIVNEQLPKQIREKTFFCPLFIEKGFENTCKYSLPELTLASSAQIFAASEKQAVAAQMQSEYQDVSNVYFNYDPKPKDEVTEELQERLAVGREAPNPSPFPTVLQPSADALPFFAPPRNQSPPPAVIDEVENSAIQEKEPKRL